MMNETFQELHASNLFPNHATRSSDPCETLDSGNIAGGSIFDLSEGERYLPLPISFEDLREDFFNFLRKEAGAYSILYYNSIGRVDWFKYRLNLGHIGFASEGFWAMMNGGEVDKARSLLFSLSAYHYPRIWCRQMLVRISKEMLDLERSSPTAIDFDYTYTLLNRSADVIEISVPHDPHPRDFVGKFGKELYVSMWDSWDRGTCIRRSCEIKDIHGCLMKGDTLNGKEVDWEEVKIWIYGNCKVNRDDDFDIAVEEETCLHLVASSDKLLPPAQRR
jgi:hypothetical protein